MSKHERWQRIEPERSRMINADDGCDTNVLRLSREDGLRLQYYRRGGVGTYHIFVFFFFQAEDGIRDYKVTGVQTCALPICARAEHRNGGTQTPTPAPPRRTASRRRHAAFPSRSSRYHAAAPTTHAPPTNSKIGRAACRGRG